MNPANQKVADALDALGIACNIQFLDHETRTSVQAAEALNCAVAQIAKSLIFKTQSDHPVLAVTSGANRVQLELLSEIIGQPVGKADAAFVRDATGFVIGGVAPVAMPQEVHTVFDRSLFDHQTVWAAAGTPNSLFAIVTDDLYKLAQNRIYDFTEPMD